MAEERVQRRLAAILAADVVGYSRLMAEDETGTLAALKAHRKELIEPKSAEYHGRIVKLTGDGTLMEFDSAVDAVVFAVDVQRAMVERNAQAPEDRRITYRIGINIGDIIVEGDDIYGDGVNVAARLEGLADPGGICVARNVYNQVKAKVDVTFEDLGAQEVKNISEPLQVYSVHLDADAVPRLTGEKQNQAIPKLPDRPSIAVLPFENMSADPEQEYFSDGISEDLITDLSKIPNLFVVARHSSFAYKGQAFDLQNVARDLRVRHILEGSVRLAGNRVRVNAQLIDVATGGHVWAERYDRDLEDIFALQDDVVRNIVQVLAEKVTIGDAGIVERGRPTNLEAYDLVLRGRDLYHRYAAMDNAEAKRVLRRAIELDPSYGSAYVWLANCLWMDWQNKWSGSETSLIDACYEAATKAVELDPGEPLSHLVLGIAHFYRRDRASALKEYQTALELQPDQPDVLVYFAELLVCDGRPLDAIDWLRKAMRLNPHHPPIYTWWLGFAQYAARQYEETIVTLRQMPRLGEARRILAASLAQLGRTEEARAEAQEFLKVDPDFSARYWVSTQPFQYEADQQHFIEGYVKAGLPE